MLDVRMRAFELQEAEYRGYIVKCEEGAFKFNFIARFSNGNLFSSPENIFLSCF